MKHNNVKQSSVCLPSTGKKKRENITEINYKKIWELCIKTATAKLFPQKWHTHIEIFLTLTARKRLFFVPWFR